MATLKQLAGRKALAIAEAAALSGLSRDFFYDEIRRGRLVARKAGRRTVIIQEDLERFLASLPKMGTGTAA
jgi:excisionase family DNA binding protein